MIFLMVLLTVVVFAVVDLTLRLTLKQMQVNRSRAANVSRRWTSD
jgi:uncharacterized metal-binding protein